MAQIQERRLALKILIMILLRMSSKFYTRARRSYTLTENLRILLT